VLQENAETGSSSTYSFTMPSGYDGVGNPVAVNDSVGLDWTFTYDHLNRLSTATGGANFAGQGMSWTYDSFGNRKTQAITGADLQQYAANAAYNSNGNNQAISTNLIGAVGYDQAGNITNDGVNSYAIDAESRICSYHDSVLSQNWTNVYDAGGHRVAKGQVPSGSSCYTGNNFFPTETDVLGQSGEQFSTVCVPGGTCSPTGWVRTNVYANGQLLATYEGSGVYFALNDWLGSKRKLINGTGSTIENSMSLWYGDGTVLSGSPDASDHHFTGQLHDAQSGLDYFGARFYQSKMGRFLSPDPSQLYFADPTNPQSLNLYSYGRNNPLTNIDPTGLDCVHINNDTGAYESFDSGDCNNSTEALANSGHYVDGTINQISFNGQNQVIGYSGSTGDGNFDSFAGSTSMDVGPAAVNLNPYTNALTSPGQSVNVNGTSPTGPSVSSVNISNLIPAGGLQPASGVPQMRAYHPPAAPQLNNDPACYGAPDAVSDIHNLQRGVYQNSPQGSTDGSFGSSIWQSTTQGVKPFGNAAADAGFNAGFMGLDYAVSVGNCLQGH
jgi:RHS repeat-associated protein